MTELTVRPEQADEGEVFRFRATVENPSGSLLNYRWDFGDGTVVESVTNLAAYRHRYLDDGSYTATLEVRLPSGEGDSERVRVTVDNVAPEVRHVERSTDPVRGGEVTFAASVVDPGRDDLTFTWDLGDGSAPVVRRNARTVTHAYDEDGQYLLTLEVRDDDGDEVSHQEVVLVGEGFAFTATGAVTTAEQVGSSPALAGMPIVQRADGRLAFRGDLGKVLRGENPAEGFGHCLVVMQSDAKPPGSGLALTFTAVLSGGLREGTFPVASQRNELPIPVHDAFEEELASPEVFFATLSDIVRVDGAPEGTSFHGTGGTLTVHSYDGDRMEATFTVNLEETFGPLDTIGTAAGLTFPPPRRATVRGRFVHDLDRTMLGGSEETPFGDFYLCDSDEELQVESHDLGADPPPTPSASGRPFLENMPWERTHYLSEEAKLEFTFDRPMLRSSLDDDSVVLEVYQETYAGTGEPFMQVYGTVEAVDDRTYRFVPDADLRDGVVYQMTLMPGQTGVRGRHGEMMEEPYRWTFSTRVEVQNVEAHTYQVARDAPLVAGKPTLTRVYPFWRKHDDLPEASQVASFPADVVVRVDGQEVYPPKRGVYVTRPDLLGESDTELARNSVNFFGWEPSRRSGTSQLEVTLEPSYQPQPEPERVESEPLVVRHAPRAPRLTFDYYFLRVRDWDGQVPQGFVSTGHRLMQEGARITTQNLPVVETVPRSRGTLDVPLSFALPWQPSRDGFGDDPLVELPDCFVPYPEMAYEDAEAFPFLAGLDTHLAWELLKATRYSDADAVVGIVPPELAGQCGWAGIMQNFANDVPAFAENFAENVHTDRVILVSGDAPWYVVAHEFGHFFGLCHLEDAHRPGCVPLPQHNEGFRIAPDGGRGWNKSDSEGNPESIGLLPLMTGEGVGMVDPHGPGDADEGLYFVTNEHYRRLLENLERVALSAAATSAFASTGADAPSVWREAAERPHIEVTGFVSPDGDAATITAVRPAPSGTGAAAGGAYRLSLLDAVGESLASVRVQALAPRAMDGRDDDVRLFEAVLAWHPAARALELTREGRTLARRERSLHPPELGLEETGATVSWRADDPDGDPLRFDVSYSPDGHTWAPVARGLGDATFTLPAGLEPGADPTVRVTASDGFDWADVRAPLEIEPPLRVLTTVPGEGETLAPGSNVYLFVNAELDPDSAQEEALTMTTADGSAVPVSVQRVSGGRGLMLTPTGRLERGRYRVRATGLRASSGPPLARPVVWSVRVEDDRDTAGEAEGEQPVAELPRTCGGMDRTRILELLPADHVLLRVVGEASCTLELTLPLPLPRAQVALETSTIRQGFLPTRNVQREEARILGFRDDTVVGEAELYVEGGTTHLRLTLAPAQSVDPP